MATRTMNLGGQTVPRSTDHFRNVGSIEGIMGPGHEMTRYDGRTRREGNYFQSSQNESSLGQIASYPTDTLSPPEAFRNKMLHLGTIVLKHTQIGQKYTTLFIAPITLVTGTQLVTWETQEFNARPLGSVPYEGVPDVITESRNKYQAVMNRFALAFRWNIESGFSELGVDSFRKKSEQLAASIVLSCHLLVLEAILSQKDISFLEIKSAVDASVPVKESLRQAVGNASFIHGFMQKNREGGQLLLRLLERTFKGPKADINFIIVSQSARGAVVTESSSFNWPSFVQPYSFNVPYEQISNTKTDIVKNTRIACFTETDYTMEADENIRPLHHRNSYGRFYPCKFVPSCIGKYTPNSRDIEIPDHDVKSFVTLKFLDVLKYTGMFNSDGVFSPPIQPINGDPFYLDFYQDDGNPIRKFGDIRYLRSDLTNHEDYSLSEEINNYILDTLKATFQAKYPTIFTSVYADMQKRIAERVPEDFEHYPIHDENPAQDVEGQDHEVNDEDVTFGENTILKPLILRPAAILLKRMCCKLAGNEHLFEESPDNFTYLHDISEGIIGVDTDDMDYIAPAVQRDPDYYRKARNELFNDVDNILKHAYYNTPFTLQGITTAQAMGVDPPLSIYVLQPDGLFITSDIIMGVGGSDSARTFLGDTNTMQQDNAIIKVSIQHLSTHILVVIIDPSKFIIANDASIERYLGGLGSQFHTSYFDYRPNDGNALSATGNVLSLTAMLTRPNDPMDAIVASCGSFSVVGDSSNIKHMDPPNWERCSYGQYYAGVWLQNNRTITNTYVCYDLQSRDGNELYPNILCHRGTFRVWDKVQQRMSDNIPTKGHAGIFENSLTSDVWAGYTSLHSLVDAADKSVMSVSNIN